jgi:hypothetical protein
MNRHRISRASLACTLMALAGCGTEEIPGHRLVPSVQAGPDKGGVLVAFSPTEDTYEAAEQAMTSSTRTEYHLLVDGDVVTESGGSPLFTTLVGGNPNWVYYLPAGPHHFAIGAAGAPPIFESDGQVPAGGTANLFLYGPLDRVKAVLAPTPGTPSPGNEHITVVNLMRSGQTIEVVTCNDATSCTPISPALALGDVFDAEGPAVFDVCDRISSPPGSWSEGGCFTSRTSKGTGVGYRFVPSASLPNPPVTALGWGATDAADADPRPAIFVAAPVFMTAQGQPQFVLF